MGEGGRGAGWRRERCRSVGLVVSWGRTTSAYKGRMVVVNHPFVALKRAAPLGPGVGVGADACLARKQARSLRVLLCGA